MSGSRLEKIAEEWYEKLPALNEEYGDDFVCGLSYGIYCSNSAGTVSFKDVMDNADEKMYEVKKEKRAKRENL